MKLDVVIVEESIVVENDALGLAIALTFVAFAAGEFEVTVGAGAGGAEPAVVKLHVTALASATPSAALTVVSSFAVYVVLEASALLGVSVAVLVPLL